MSYAILTFGCRVNQADSQACEEALRAAGFEPRDPLCAQVVVVNTCSVTATADQGARQAIRRIARTNPAARIVVTGCYATRCGDEVSALPSVVKVVPNAAKEDLVAALMAESRAAGERYGVHDGPCGSPLEPGLAGRTAFTLRVQTGCDESCAFCVIPSTRGRGRSLPLPDVLASARRAADAGYKEIVLTGVHLGSYGRDLPSPTGLAGLLRALDRMGGDVRYRVSSLEPGDCGDDLVRMAAEGGRLLPHFHLPLQHGSDAVLRRMRRPYSVRAYGRLVDGIRRRIPHASIGSDVMVGFPGESDGEFEASLAYLRGSPLTHLHVFPYSDRPGTEADGMRLKVPGATIKERARIVREAGATLAAGFRRSQVGTIRPGLTLESGALVVTDNFLKVRIPAGRPRNERVSIRIAEDGADLVGDVVAAGVVARGAASS